MTQREITFDSFRSWLMDNLYLYEMSLSHNPRDRRVRPGYFVWLQEFIDYTAFAAEAGEGKARGEG